MSILTAHFKIHLADMVKVLSVSDGVEALLGYQAGDFLTGGVSLKARIHAHDQDVADALFSADAAQPRGAVNIRLRQANGFIRCVKVLYSREQAAPDDGVLLELELQDAKSLWQAQNTIPMTANFKAMMENTDDYIYFKDRNHVFTGASQTLVTITHPASRWTDLLGQTDYDVFPEELADIYYRLEKQVFSGMPVAREIQETLDNEGHHGWVDNRKYPIKDDNGEIIGLFGIARDITEQKRLLDEQSAILQNRLVGIATVRDRNIIWANSAFERLLGYAKNELVGLPTRLFYVYKKDYQSIGAAYANLAKEQVLRRQYEFLRKDGQHVWVDMTGAVLHEDTGESLWIFVDATERKLAEESLKIAATAFDAKVGIIVTDSDCNILRVNPTFTAITGYTGDEVIGKRPGFLESPRHGQDFYAAMWESVKNHDVWEGEVWNVRKNGEEYPEQVNITAVRDSLGILTNYVATFTDISDHVRLLAELENQAKRDPLTGLANRRNFLERAEVELSRARRYRSPLSMLMMDVDCFKEVNDRFGHKAGDLVLQRLAHASNELLRDVDVIGRIGGEEFAVLLPETDAASAREVADRLRQRFQQEEVLLEDATACICFTVSIGVSSTDDAEITVDKLLQKADGALYQAKYSGKNRVVAV